MKILLYSQYYYIFKILICIIYICKSISYYICHQNHLQFMQKTKMLFSYIVKLL